MLAYGSAIRAVGVKLKSRRPPRVNGSGPCVRIWMCGIEQPQSMFVVQYGSEPSLCFSHITTEGSMWVVAVGMLDPVVD